MLSVSLMSTELKRGGWTLLVYVCFSTLLNIFQSLSLLVILLFNFHCIVVTFNGQFKTLLKVFCASLLVFCAHHSTVYSSNSQDNTARTILWSPISVLCLLASQIITHILSQGERGVKNNSNLSVPFVVILENNKIELSTAKLSREVSS